MLNLIGWLGISFVLVSYLFLNSKRPNIFLILNAVGSYVLLVHSIIISDFPFMVLSLVAGITFTIKLMRGGIK